MADPGRPPEPGGGACASGAATAGGCAPRLQDYRAHYTADAEFLSCYEPMHADRQAAEKRRLGWLVRCLAPRRGERLLDIGCGSGLLGSLGAAAGARVCVLDIAWRGVAGARARFPQLEQAVVGDAYALPFASESLGAVVLSEVLEHLEDMPRALAEVRRALRPAGRVLVSVPYRERILYHLCIHCNRLTPANAHLHRFGRGDLESLLAASGLQPRRTWLLTNKLLERVGFSRWTQAWPQSCWRLIDAAANRLLGHAGYVCVLATKVR